MTHDRLWAKLNRGLFKTQLTSAPFLSTQLRGDFDTVVTTVARALRASAERFGRQVLVCKFIPGALAIDAAP